MTNSRRLTLSLLVLGFVWSVAAAILLTGVADAAVLGRKAPTPANSNPDGSHVFFLRKSPTAGENPRLSLTVHYPADVSDWNSQYIEIDPGGDLAVNEDEKVCNIDTAGMNATQRSQFITVELQSEGRATETYHIPSNNVCAQTNTKNTAGGSNNRFFGRYPLPPKPSAVNSKTERYLVTLSVKYHDAVPQGDNGIRFSAMGDTPGLKIGPLGGDGFAFPLLNHWGNKSYATDIKVPFGLCGGSGVRTVGVYDADNGPEYGFYPREVKFRVFDVTDNEWQPYSNGVGGHRNAADWYVPADTISNATPSFIDINMEEDHQYELRVNEISYRNTIVLKVPGQTIFGDEDICQPAKFNINGKSFVNGVEGDVTVKPGDVVSYDHWIKNVGKETSDPIDGAVYWSSAKTGKVSGSDITNRRINSGETVNRPTSGAYTFTIPSTAVDGQRYCQHIDWKPETTKDPSRGESQPRACAVVDRPSLPPPGSKYVQLQATVTPGGDTETAGTANFTGKVTVSNFPTPDDGGWGYNERAKANPAQRVAATKVAEGSTPEYQYVCPAGTTKSGSGSSTICTTPGSSYCAHSDDTARVAGDCRHERPAYTKKAGCEAAGYTWGGTNCYSTHAKTTVAAVNNPASIQYRWRCAQDNSTTAWSSSITVSTCRDQYSCPTSTGTATGWYASAPACTAWQCKYPSASDASRRTDPISYTTLAPLCSYRCSSGYGDKAYKSTSWDDKYGTTDRRCFVQPRFTLTCIWDTGAQSAQDVDRNGDFCSTNTTKSAGNIGTQVCAKLTPKMPSYPGSWSPSSPLPGQVALDPSGSYQMNTWGWTALSDTKCSNVVGMPYVKVFGGDVRVGGGVGASTVTGCAFTSSATIKTYNQGSAGSYAGAGTQHGAFSMGFIDRFVSGQYNSYAGPPTGLTFANNAGGSGYGGGFNDTGGCTGFVEGLASDAQQITGDHTQPNLSLNSGQKVVKHVTGNVFIANNVTYNASWASTLEIPLYQLVVEGDIFISQSVSQLDGLYVAVPRANGTGGNIYTCSVGSNSVPTTTFGNCKSQLVVNGAFAAKKIHFLRDCSSLRYSSLDSGTVYSGGNDQNTCSPNSHAAEIFNYTPEQWIRGSVGGGSNKYDAMSSLPPIL